MEPSDLHFNWNNSFSDSRSDAGRNWKGSPKLTQAPPDDYDDVDWGEDWKWRVRIKGKRPITIELYKDGIMVKKQRYYTDMTIFQCTIKSVTYDERGDYELAIRNRLGTVVTYRTLYVT